IDTDNGEGNSVQHTIKEILNYNPPKSLISGIYPYENVEFTSQGPNTQYWCGDKLCLPETTVQNKTLSEVETVNRTEALYEKSKKSKNSSSDHRSNENQKRLPVLKTPTPRYKEEFNNFSRA
ncbi:10974_t:CDS:2, partial [Dentiscutata erythropus]